MFGRLQSLLLAAVLGVTPSGCSDIAGPPPDLPGSYRLVGFNGDYPPTLLVLTSFTTVLLAEGELTLNEDRTCDHSLTFQFEDRGGPGTSWFEWDAWQDIQRGSCIWQQDGSSVVVTADFNGSVRRARGWADSPADPRRFTGRASASSVTLTAGGSEYVFERERN
jgi:hypothetical protein